MLFLINFFHYGKDIEIKSILYVRRKMKKSNEIVKNCQIKNCKQMIVTNDNYIIEFFGKI